MHNLLRKELFFLRAYVIASTVLLSFLGLTAFNTPSTKQKFDELDVERLNIVDSTGKLCFVLTNGTRAPGAIIGGKEIRRSMSNNAPAILFYNEEGDESGALLTVGKVKDRGGYNGYYGSSRLVFDRFRHDETMAFQYYEDEISSYAGMLIQDTREMTSAEWAKRNEAVRAMPDGPQKKEARKNLKMMRAGEENEFSLGKTETMQPW